MFQRIKQYLSELRDRWFKKKEQEPCNCHICEQQRDRMERNFVIPRQRRRRYS